ncbi:nuclear transport factor 2 family protein [Myxococcota bacterium]|nr:nuclear transport factor 2 family protein [Myxococcota bacterium]
MIEATLERWFDLIHGNDVGDRSAFLDDLLDPEVVFYSPVVFTPQRGREVTKLYLLAAGSTFGGEPRGERAEGKGEDRENGFRYTKKVITGNQAILEFETNMGGKYVNGVDIITCNDEGRIVEFKVMIRPLQAVNMVHAKMGAMLKKMQGDSSRA